MFRRISPFTFILLIGLAVALLGNLVTHVLTWLRINLFALFYDDWLLIGLFAVLVTLSYFLGRRSHEV